MMTMTMNDQLRFGVYRHFGFGSAKEKYVLCQDVAGFGIIWMIWERLLTNWYCSFKD
jgi:hypothetical protein